MVHFSSKLFVDICYENELPKSKVVMKDLLTGAILYLIGQVLVWFQSNGQFIWKWFDENPILISIFSGTVASYVFIIGTKYIVTHFQGLLWPAKFISFGIGMAAFATLTWLFMGEELTMKTLVSICLSFILICVQIFWK